MRKTMRRKRTTVALCLTLALATSAFAQDIQPVKEELLQPIKIYSPFVERTANDKSFAEGLYWGDTHLHTKYSVDAGMIGTMLGPDEAYRFAKGEEVISNSGQRARLNRPLDFLMVADHAENLGLFPLLAESNPDVLNTEYGKRWHDMLKAGKGYDAYQEWSVEVFLNLKDPIGAPKVARTAWDREIEAAERHNQPGVFTAIIGFEWSSSPDARNLHRVVMFKDNADKAGQVIPFSSVDSGDPEDLWRYMAAYEEKTGGSILAIPHNGNWSNGLMFSVERRNGKPIDRQYAETRMRWEPLYEVTQIKGDGEAHPYLSPSDEWADYGTWDKGDAGGIVAKENDMLQYEYARSALQIGLQQELKIGENPFKFGMIGATDSHTGMSTSRDDNYWGKFASTEPAADRYKHYVIKSVAGNEELSTFAWEEVSSGLSGVWARENTREAIFDAMMRKEVYATTGSRISVRVFAGWDYKAVEVESPDFAERGYRGGVPMGGDLSKAPEGKAPRFMVQAMRGPDDANLDRVQVIKGWLDSSGKKHERIYDLICSDGRAIVERRCEKLVGNTVDVEDASYTNAIGDPFLTAFWEDPDFVAEQRAVYYVRVLEIPTPTWQAHDAKFYGITMPKQVPLIHQERAYTSPIWYTP
jgi:hypothetical protein